MNEQEETFWGENSAKFVICDWICYCQHEQDTISATD